MADVTANITLNTTGGDNAAQEIQKAGDAMNQISASSSGMQEMFQHRFQHIGLMLFAGDALRAAGLGAETRMVIQSLNIALTEAAAAAGIGSGGIMLLVTAFIALAGIIEKVISRHKDNLDSLEKTVKGQQDALASTESNISAIEAYAAAVGTLTPQQQQLLEAEKNLASLQHDQLFNSEIQELEAVRARIQANIQHAQTMALLSEWYKEFKVALVEAFTQLTGGIPVLQTIGKIYDAEVSSIQTLVSAFHQHASTVQLNAEQTKKLTDENASLNAKMQEITATLGAGTMEWQKYFKTIVDDQKTAMDAIKTANDAYINNQIVQLRNELNSEQMTQKQVYEAMKANNKDLYTAIEADEEAHKSMFSQVFGEMGKEAANVFSDMNRQFAQATAQMIAEGVSMRDQWHNIVQSIEESFISAVEQMILKWMEFQALTGIFGMGGGTANSFLGTAFSGAATSGHATAGATFTPMSGGGSLSSGAAGGPQVNNVTVNVSGVIDDRMVSKIGQSIVQSIRGQGQLAFTGI